MMAHMNIRKNSLNGYTLKCVPYFIVYVYKKDVIIYDDYIDNVYIIVYTISIINKEMSYMKMIEKYIPKKYRFTIEDFYKDFDGVWLELKPDYISTDTEASTIHENSINEVKKKLKTIMPREELKKMNRMEVEEYLKKKWK